MAKILLLDFNDTEFTLLSRKKFDVELKKTNWYTGKNISLIPSKDCQIVFYNIDLDNIASSVHSGDCKNFIRIVEEGGVIICFVGKCSPYHLANIVGNFPALAFRTYSESRWIFSTQNEPLNLVFSRFGADIVYTYELFFNKSVKLGDKIKLENWDPKYKGELEVLAISRNNVSVAVIIREGKGFYLFLPWFEDKNIEIVELFLTEILPKLAPHLFFDEEYKWLDNYRYYFPSLLKLNRKKEGETKKYKRTIIKLNEKIKEIKEKEQELFNELLKAQGEKLKQAVINAFKYVGWHEVIDVDKYWEAKDASRKKEEDIWLFDDDDRPIEDKMIKDKVLLIETKGSKGGATDDDCGTLQKYKARRMKEFNNTEMKAILIGNYFNRNEAESRKNPFSPAQIEDAERDGNGLLTTYELFKAIKAEKENKIKKQQIRHQIKEKSGLIEFNY